MNVLVIGYGSIGKRHVEILQSLKCNVFIVSKQLNKDILCYPTLEIAFAEQTYDYIVIANKTNEHKHTLDKLQQLGCSCAVLVEKPLYATYCEAIYDFEIYVGYNLRFHPITQYLKNSIEKENIISIQGYVGQYLPSWRPNTDYSASYSASKANGGGVLRDLSHELDLYHYLFGEWCSLQALVEKVTNLKITSDDHVLLQYRNREGSLVQLTLNYLDHIHQRKIIVNTTTSTYIADYINNTIVHNEQVINFKSKRNDTYFLQHTALLKKDYTIVCNYNEGLYTNKMIDKIEQASIEKVTIFNE